MITLTEDTWVAGCNAKVWKTGLIIKHWKSLNVINLGQRGTDDIKSDDNNNCLFSYT